MSKKTLVTSGAIFIGSAVVRHIIQHTNDKVPKLDKLTYAGLVVETSEMRQGYKIACLEEIAYNHGWLSTEQIKAQAKALSKNSYGKYLAGQVKR